MADIPESSFATIMIVVMTILPFFSTSALDRIDELDSTGVDGHLKFASLVSLFLAYFAVITVSASTLYVWGVLKPSLLLTAVYTVFIALYLPGIVLLVPKMIEAQNLWRDPELDTRYQLVALSIIALILAVLIQSNPGG